MATAKKVVKKQPTKKAAPAKRKPVPVTKHGPQTPRKLKTELAPRPAAKFDSMVEEVDEASIPKTSLSVYSDTPQLDGSDLFIPRLRLAQGLTAEVQAGEAKPGQWLILGTEPMTEANVIPVAMTRRRELRDPDTRSTVCRSGDGLTGIGNPGGECATCPMADWVPGVGKNKGKNAPPPCAFFYSYMVYVMEAETMAILEFSRTSITSGKMLNTIIAQHGLGTFAVRLTATKKEGTKGTFYSPTVNQATVKPDALRIALAKAKQTY